MAQPASSHDMNERRGETPVVKSANQARGGVTGHNVRTVLAISTAAVVVLFGSVLLLFFS